LIRVLRERDAPDQWSHFCVSFLTQETAAAQALPAILMLNLFFHFAVIRL
jgi:hypothetical protein